MLEFLLIKSLDNFTVGSVFYYLYLPGEIIVY